MFLLKTRCYALFSDVLSDSYFTSKRLLLPTRDCYAQPQRYSLARKTMLLVCAARNCYSFFHLNITIEAETLGEFTTRRKNNCGNKVAAFN